MNMNPEPRRTLADIIMEKLTEKKTEIRSQFSDGESVKADIEIDPRVKVVLFNFFYTSFVIHICDVVNLLCYIFNIVLTLKIILCIFKYFRKCTEVLEMSFLSIGVVNYQKPSR